ncbi:hypothetical protein GQ53DRAFT_63434 [Thozetella sp. PMI_491]|nr:hypothetical protein GQ53DRAFT_63434 [Thozetella sp. PMI_491]
MKVDGRVQGPEAPEKSGLRSPYRGRLCLIAHHLCFFFRPQRRARNVLVTNATCYHPFWCGGIAACDERERRVMVRYHLQQSLSSHLRHRSGRVRLFSASAVNGLARNCAVPRRRQRALSLSEQRAPSGPSLHVTNAPGNFWGLASHSTYIISHTPTRSVRCPRCTTMYP